VTTTWPFVVGTAGHIDHGKTALVHALTGIDTDRLAVEKARGITTELGFAHLDLPGGARVAVVDVPGHERFIRAMVAGATGLDLVLLVVAADEGIMPQTREHLDVCQLLGVRRGLVVITKRDLVDADWLAMLDEELAAAFAGTFLADAPRLAVSAKTGAGLPALVAAIEAALTGLPPRPGAGSCACRSIGCSRLRGFGTVVTGTIVSGQRSRSATRSRCIRAGWRPGCAGCTSTASRSSGPPPGSARPSTCRGSPSRSWRAATSWATPARWRRATCSTCGCGTIAAATAAAMPTRSKVLVHHGADPGAARRWWWPARRCAPGAEGVAQLRVDRATPLAALPGDRFLVRGFTAAGEPRHDARRRRDRAGPRAQARRQRRGPRRRARRGGGALRPGPPGRAGRARAARVRRRRCRRRRPWRSASAWPAPSSTRSSRSCSPAASCSGSGDDLLHVETVAALERTIAARLAAAPDGAVAARGAALSGCRRRCRCALLRRWSSASWRAAARSPPTADVVRKRRRRRARGWRPAPTPRCTEQVPRLGARAAAPQGDLAARPIAPDRGGSSSRRSIAWSRPS
jgi:small GTP-binding protein